MHIPTLSRQNALIAIGFAMSGVVALSIHVTMLGYGVPFPIANPPLVAQWLSEACLVAAILLAIRFADPSLRALGRGGRVAIVFVMTAAIQETLRVAIMSGLVTGAWMYAALGLVKPVLHLLVLAVLCVLLVHKTQRPLSFLVAALMVGAAGILAKMAIATALAPLLERLAWLARPDQYAFPYPFHINVAAYLTFSEAAAGAALLTIMIWDRLPHGTPARLVIVSLLVAAIKGVIGAILLYSPFTGTHLLSGALAWSQFVFEFLALGLLTALTWSLASQKCPAG